MITKRTFIWLILVLLVTASAYYGLARRPKLRALFESQVDITDAVALERISGARAGTVVAPRDDLATVQHTVERGDNWTRIAKKYGVADYNELSQHNGHVALKVGMVIEVPAELRNQP